MDGRLLLDTFTSNYDTVMAVWSENLAPVACNDDFNGVQSSIEAQVIAGKTYFIEIGQKGSVLNALQDRNPESATLNLQNGGTLVFHLNLIPPDFIFEDDFESCNLRLWKQRQLDGGDLSAGHAPMSGDCAVIAVIDDNNPLFVGDLTPVAEPRYRVRFYFHPNSISMVSGDSHTIFQGYRQSADLVLTVEFRRYLGKYQLRAGLKRDDGTWRRTSWYAISNSIHFIELNWWASTSKSASNGGLTVWIDEIQKFTATAVDNDTKRIDKVRMGPSASIDPGTRGTYYFDRFKSTRGTPIGP
jgi:hypothetical protein